MDIGSKLKFLRTKSQINQKEIAEYLGVKVNSYSQYENNHRKPDYETIKNICDYYEVSLNYFFNDDNFIFDEEDEIDFAMDEDFQNGIYFLNQYVRLAITAKKIMNKMDSLDLSYREEANEYHKYKDELGDIFTKILDTQKMMDNFANFLNIEDEIVDYLK